MKRNFKALIVAFALAMALVLTVTRQDAHRLGLGAGQPSHATPAAGGDRARGDLTAMRIFNSTLMRVNDQYVDPTRVDPKAMLLSSLDSVQKNVAEVLVEPHPAENRVTVRVDTAAQDFAIGDVDSPWMLAQKMKEIFKFIGANVQPGTDTKELEYAAVNGMLSTLDPHSILLDPTTYTEMKLTTRGHFGGLGIVIGLRKNQLIVVRPVPGTPAASAGVKAGDKIIRIEQESTVNMNLNDAVSRLRGEPDSKVEVWFQRGDQPAKRLVLTRAVISFNTVQSHSLPNGIGYIRLTQFSGNTYEEMHRAIEQMKQSGNFKGLILDLRSDPGGLLDQAIKVADEFVDAGTIVTTVGFANKQRDEKRAGAGTQPHVPMAVLVNGQSASASEIVAGALKNLDRAVIIGNRTFGKGSVQVLYDNDDGSALKLTIAQYLTPGDISIQSVGIVPDLMLEPTLIAKDRVSIFRPSHSLREQDLDAHLTSRNARTGDKPSETVRYLAERPKTAADAAQGAKGAKGEDKSDDDKGADDDDDDDAAAEAAADGDKFVEDYEITMARELLAQAHGWRRREVLASSKVFFEKKAAEQQQKITEGLRKLGIDWSKGGQTAPGQFEAKIVADKPNGEVKAGDTITLTATVRNTGTQPAYQVRGITKCDDPFMEDREFVFGKLMPGESRSWSAPIKVDRAALSRLDLVKLEVSDEGGAKVDGNQAQVKIAGIARPRFAYSYQLIDDVKGNGDGLVELGESLRLHVTVKNVGDGKAFETLATVSNKSGDGVTINKGRFNVDNLGPGESKTIDFTFDVTPEFSGDALTMQMDVFDAVLHEFVTEKLTFPVAQSAAPVTAAQGAVTVTADNAQLLAGAAAQAQVLGKASKGSTFRLTGGAADYYRVELEPGRPAFLPKNAVTMANANGASASRVVTQPFASQLQVVPPRIALDNPPLVVDGKNMHLRGTASDEHQVTDLYVFVSNRGSKIEHKKVFYLSNRKANDPHSMPFETTIPVWPGANVVTVVARQSNQVQAQQTLIVQSTDKTHQATAAAAAVPK
ncbi:MAG TPA: MXAN_5808 family serine peptidase [Polyangia bacterium]|jgi:carboxyl-terminal processing protease|nr:MXAN_5808 family serine peptidase [Polyangia bacterium]